MPKNTTNHDDLVRLEARLDRWRHRHGGRGRRIPSELWQEAAHAAQTLGADAVARRLRVRRERLQDMVARLDPTVDVDGGREFVEIPWPASTVPVQAALSDVTVVQLEAPDGRRLRLEVSSAAGFDVGAIVAAFLEGDS